MRHFCLRIHFADGTKHPVLHDKRLFTGRIRPAQRTLAYGSVVVQPEIVAVVVGPKRPREGGRIAGNDIQCLFAVDATIIIRGTPPAGIHPEHRRILCEQLTRKEFAHRMQLMLDADTVTPAIPLKTSTFRGRQESGNLGRCNVCTDGIDAEAIRHRRPVHFGEFLRRKDEAPHLPPRRPVGSPGAGDNRQQQGQADAKETPRLHQRPSFLKKSFPLSSTRMKAGKSSTVIFQMASIPRSGYSTHSMLRMRLWESTAATPPIVPR